MSVIFLRKDPSDSFYPDLSALFIFCLFAFNCKAMLVFGDREHDSWEYKDLNTVRFFSYIFYFINNLLTMALISFGPHFHKATVLNIK
jgi:hypothetical protein